MKRAFIVTDRGRVVADSVLQGYALKSHSRQLVEQDAFEGVRGVRRPATDPAILVKLLEVNTAHYAACRQKAQDTAGIGWRFDKIADNASEADRQRLEDFFNELPPPENDRDDDDLQLVFEAASLDYEAIGRGAFELVREDHEADGPPETIVHVPAHTLRTHRDGIRLLQIRGGKRRWFKWIGADADVDFRTGRVVESGTLSADRRATEIVWWRNYHPADPVYGLPDVLPAIGAIVGDLGRRDYNIEFFSNFGVPAYAVFVTGDFDPGPVVNEDGVPVPEDDPLGRTELEWNIEQQFAEIRGNPHASMVFVLPTRAGPNGESIDGEVKIEFRPLATEVKEASFRLYRTDNREEVLSSHRMSAAIAGVFNAGAANREALAGYKRSVIRPRQRRLERVVNRYIVRGAFNIRGWAWRLLANDAREDAADLELLRALQGMGAVSSDEVREHFIERLGLAAGGSPESPDAGVQAVGIPTLIQQGVITPNEGRQMVGLPTITGGDVLREPPAPGDRVAPPPGPAA